VNRVSGIVGSCSWLEHPHATEVPRLMIEPGKAECAAIAVRINAPVSAVLPGDQDTVPDGTDHLESEPGFPLQTHIEPTQLPCGTGETRWRAGRCRWANIEHTLHDPKLPPNRTHPTSPTAWPQRGLHLPGATLAEHRDLLHAHPHNWADLRVAIGPRPSRLAAGIDRLDRATEIEQQLRYATTRLHRLTRRSLARLEPSDPATTWVRGGL
jgi:hypothetical protein